MTQKSQYIIAERQADLHTDQVIRIGDDFFYRRINGGSEGIREINVNRPSVLDVGSLDLAGVKRMLLEFGYEPEHIVGMLAPSSADIVSLAPAAKPEEAP